MLRTQSGNCVGKHTSALDHPTRNVKRIRSIERDAHAELGHGTVHDDLSVDKLIATLDHEIAPGHLGVFTQQGARHFNVPQVPAAIGDPTSGDRRHGRLLCAIHNGTGLDGPEAEFPGENRADKPVVLFHDAARRGPIIESHPGLDQQILDPFTDLGDVEDQLPPVRLDLGRREHQTPKRRRQQIQVLRCGPGPEPHGNLTGNGRIGRREYDLLAGPGQLPCGDACGQCAFNHQDIAAVEYGDRRLRGRGDLGACHEREQKKEDHAEHAEVCRRPSTTVPWPAETDACAAGNGTIHGNSQCNTHRRLSRSEEESSWGHNSSGDGSPGPW